MSVMMMHVRIGHKRRQAPTTPQHIEMRKRKRMQIQAKVFLIIFTCV